MKLSLHVRTLLLTFLTSFTMMSVRAQLSDLIISEYSEDGNVHTDWLELYNGTGASVDLSDYRLVRFFGSTSASSSYALSLSGTLSDGSTYVIASSANTYAVVNAATDMALSGATLNMMNYSGTSAIALQKNISSVWTNIDVIGSSSSGPWTVGAGTTADVVLVRKDTVCDPQTDWTIGTTQWDVFTAGTTSDVGQHTVSCAAVVACSGTDPGATWDAVDALTSSDDLCVSSINVATGANVECNNIQVDAGFTLTISHVVTVHGDITNNGTITLEDGGYLVQQAATDNNSGSGTYHIQQLTPSYADDTRYTYWASPVADEQLQDVFPSSNTGDFYTYNNWPWTAVASTTTMTPGIGYTATGDIGSSGAFTRTFSGTQLNNGDVVASSLGTDLTDWVLLGNPYPSALDLEELGTDNAHLGSSFWLWNHNTAGATPDSTQDYAQYVTGVGGTAATSGGSVPNQYVDKCQGFMIQFTSAANVTFNNSQRVTSAASAFFKHNQHPDRHLIWLGLVSNDAPYSNQTLVGFVPGATDQYDADYDGPKLKGSQVLALYSRIDDKDLGIQGMEHLKEGEQKTIPLGVDAFRTGYYTIRLDSLASVPATHKIYLRDHATGSYINLQEQAHTFELTSTGTFRDRFVLEVSDTTETITSLEEIHDETQSRIQVMTLENQLSIALIGSRKVMIQHIRAHDIQGRLVYERKNANRPQVDIPTSSWKSGIYFVRMRTSDGKTHTSKVFR